MMVHGVYRLMPIGGFSMIPAVRIGSRPLRPWDDATGTGLARGRAGSRSDVGRPTVHAGSGHGIVHRSHSGVPKHGKAAPHRARPEHGVRVMVG